MPIFLANFNPRIDCVGSSTFGWKYVVLLIDCGAVLRSLYTSTFDRPLSHFGVPDPLLSVSQPLLREDSPRNLGQNS